MIEHSAGVPQRVLQRLRCPTCGVPVERDPEGIVCERGHRTSLGRGYLDASGDAVADQSTARTLDRFGYEWTAFDEVREEDERFAAIYFRDLDLASLAGQVGLDAGCGKGRFTRVLARHLDAVVALDGSAAVESAARNLEPLGNVVVVKDDLRTAPFAPGSFDFVTCLGVLHHLEDPHRGFERLLEYLAPGGRMLLYLYSRPSSPSLRAAALAVARIVRMVTVKLPPRLVKALALPMAWALYTGLVLPGRWGAAAGVGLLARLPLATYRDKPVRSLVLDTFDRLSAPVEHRYVWSELEWWFTDAGMTVEAARDDAGWFILAHKAVVSEMPSGPGLDGPS
jgi:SAM-dependent methyltransferase